MNDEQIEEKPTKKAKRKRKVRRQKVLGFWMLLSITFVTGLLVLVGLSLSGRELTVPNWVTTRVVERVNDNLPNGRLQLSKMAVHVNERGVPQLTLRNLGIFDNRGAELARLNEVGARISMQALLRGKIQAEELRLSGAQMTLRRNRDGKFDLSFGGGTGASGTLAGVLDSLDAAYEAEPLAGVQLLEATALTITIEDARSGRLWQVTDGFIQVQQNLENMDISVAFDVFNGTEDLAQVSLGITTDRTSSAASMGVSFSNAAAKDIALQTPILSFLGVLDAPISGSVRTAFSTKGELGSLAGTLEIGKGVLQPTPETRPLPYESAKAYFSFDPEQEKLQFSEVSFKSELATVKSSGHAYLRDISDGWPSELVAQFAVSDLQLAPEGLFEEPLRFSQGAADFRLKLNPFSLDIGQLVLIEGEERLNLTGSLKAGDEGWVVSSDLNISQLAHDKLLSLWPDSFIPNTRNWFANNVYATLLKDVQVAVRSRPNEPFRYSLGYQFEDAEIRYLKTLPTISNARGYSSLNGTAFSLMVEGGEIAAPQGGDIDMTGSFLRIDDVSQRPSRLELSLRGKSTATAVMSLLNEPPFQVLKNANFGPDVADGRAEFEAEIGFNLKPKLQMEDVSYQAEAKLFDIASTTLVPGRDIRADRMTLRASPDGVEIFGPARLGNVSADVRWSQRFGAEYKGQSNVTGTVELSQDFLDEFSIGLPKGSITGQGVGQFDLALVSGESPRFELTSDLNRMGLRVSAIGWSKSKNRTGQLSVRGTLGATANIDSLDLKAPGLTVSGGRVSVSSSGGLGKASFARVKTGGWLDAPVTLTGRGKNASPAVSINGGQIDFRKTSFGGAGGSSVSGNGPIKLALDRLIISEGISLTGFKGDFEASKGFSGKFTARVNGIGSVAGVVSPSKNGSQVRLTSNDGGAVVRGSGIFESAHGGDFVMTLKPKASGIYDGNLTIKNTRVVDAPSITELLNAISIVGLIDQMNGPGIAFTDVEARFQVTPTQIILRRSSAVGPAMGISLDGTYDLARGQMKMQGVLSPVYFLNAIGQIFSRRGEGLFGFTFRLTGSADNPKVQVNPLSILTPGAFRDIFRTAPPKLQK